MHTQFPDELIISRKTKCQVLLTTWKPIQCKYDPLVASQFGTMSAAGELGFERLANLVRQCLFADGIEKTRTVAKRITSYLSEEDSY